MTPATRTVVHVVRHGEVHNPERILYGRLPGYRLSDRGLAMAERVADHLSGRDVARVVSSPLQRARETAAPIAAAHGLEVGTDERLLEAGNSFEGTRVGAEPSLLLRRPAYLLRAWNPFLPSWGESYREIGVRMLAALDTVRREARGHEAVVVSHQLPIWTLRLHAEQKSFVHDPRKRQCTLCSLTTLHFTGDELTRVSYSEPAGDLIPTKDKNAPFSAGGAPEEKRP